MINDFFPPSPPTPLFRLLCPLSRNLFDSSPHSSPTSRRIKYQARLKDRQSVVCARARACMCARKKRNTHVDPISASRMIGKKYTALRKEHLRCTVADHPWRDRRGTSVVSDIRFFRRNSGRFSKHSLSLSLSHSPYVARCLVSCSRTLSLSPSTSHT